MASRAERPPDDDRPCTCVACQAGLAVTCAATEKRIRADERGRIVQEREAFRRAREQYEARIETLQEEVRRLRADAKPNRRKVA